MSAIYPTTTCFDDALDYFAQTGDTFATLVHGICIIPPGNDRAGSRFAHAWIERARDGRVVQCGILDGERIRYTVARDEWYAVMDVQSTTRYTYRQALAENHRSGHYGPWALEYLDLVTRRREPAEECTEDRR